MHSLTLNSAFALSVVAMVAPVHAQQQAAPTRSATAGTANEWYMPYQPGFWNYFGGSIGQSDFDLDCIEGFGCDTRRLAGKVQAGGNFREALGLELSYVYLGNAELGGGDARAQGVNLGLTLGVPLGDVARVFGKVGGVYGWTRVTGDAPGYATGKERGLDWSYGAGGTFNLNRNWQVRVDWDRYDMEFAGGRSEHIDLYSAGLQYRF